MSHRATILVVEDDAAIRDGVVAGLAGAGFAVRTATTHAEGVRAMPQDGIDLILLDLVLPGGDGLDLLARLRAVRPERAVIIMTARGAEPDRVKGLRQGADDYLVKPFGLDELLARVEAVLRRAGVRLAPAGMVLRWAGGSADLARRHAMVGAAEHDLSPQEADLLRLLAERRDRAVPREELLGLLWRAGATGLTSRAIDMTVLRLREKLADDPAAPRVVATVRGVGYRLADGVVVG
jgi:DNA-binding response OmpR family regulator